MLDAFPARSPSNDPDPDGYEPALAAVLCRHPREVAEDCADIKHGVVLECLGRRALTAGRVHDWCKRHSVDLYDFLAREDERVKAEQEARRLRDAADCGLSLEERRAVVERFHARLGPNFGLRKMDAVDVVRGKTGEEDEEAKRLHAKEQLARMNAANDRQRLAEYAARGLEPVRGGDGHVVSPALVAQVNPALLRPAKVGENPREAEYYEDRHDGAEAAE